MSSPFAKPKAGGDYFKPKEYQNAIALLLEPKDIKRGVESTFNGNTRVRDEVLTDVTVFESEGSLEKGTPDEVLKGVWVTHGMLTSALEQIIGEPAVGRISMTDTRAGRGYVFRFDLKPEDEARVAHYYEKREQEIAAAVEAAPDFE